MCYVYEYGMWCDCVCDICSMSLCLCVLRVFDVCSVSLNAYVYFVCVVYVDLLCV